MLKRLRMVCAPLPEVVEEPAWVGVRWQIRKRNFAHVLTVRDGWPAAYASAAGDDGPATLLTFRTSDVELYRSGAAGEQFFWPGWFPNLIGLMLDDASDWDEISGAVIDSYRLLAPKRLAALVDDP